MPTNSRSSTSLSASKGPPTLKSGPSTSNRYWLPGMRFVNDTNVTPSRLVLQLSGVTSTPMSDVTTAATSTGSSSADAGPAVSPASPPASTTATAAAGGQLGRAHLRTPIT